MTHQPDRRRITVFDFAAESITHDREKNYGPPLPSFTRIAGLWSAMLGTTITPQQVAHMMILLKVSRLQTAPDDIPTLTSIVGYARCAVLCGPEFVDGVPFG
jgi:hypothetical protein